MGEEMLNLAWPMLHAENFHFLSTEVLLWSAEFPFSERRILWVCLEQPLQFSVQNLHFLKAEIALSERRISIFEYRIFGVGRLGVVGGGG